ncbi:probable serine/threonine-protein kinase PBL2 isoform X2 [Brassica rapa]|uniref:probable serine/threonine-protein kinase PBL2 isoform X2 n=1 Tax=Brassica campestris TaxID=3711 RepID=UPI0004F1CF9A|nr:probable serine/threonine-protein kinase PBL2 isoform X2 [Brassica rapa]
MGNCLDSSSKVDNTRHANSVPSGISSLGSLPTHHRTEGEILSSPNLKAFSFNELKNATKNFRPDTLLGEGDFGCVFKGWIDETTLTASRPGSGIAVAIKNLKPDGFQGRKDWLTEVNNLGQLSHPNLVLLIGYCTEGENRFLVHEFMPRGSLESHLFRRGPQALTWEIRMKVAVGAAKGLTCLHEAKSQVIYGDFRSAKILLDADYNAKLSYIGLANAGPTRDDDTHVATVFMGGQGYAAPEYISTGELTAKSDVYSFGVVLLELISGRRAMDYYSNNGVRCSLVDWAKPYLGNKRKLFSIMDTKLGGQYPQKGAYTVATLALLCLNPEAKVRPKMSAVLVTLEKLESAAKPGTKYTETESL